VVEPSSVEYSLEYEFPVEYSLPVVVGKKVELYDEKTLDTDWPVVEPSSVEYSFEYEFPVEYSGVIRSEDFSLGRKKNLL
jgi:hypothetical protein